jgi:hypothetical protein
MTDAPIRPQPGRPGTYRHKGLPCRACGKYVDAMTNTDPGGGQGRDGDFMVCLGCGVVSVLVVGALGLAFREPTADELAEFTAKFGHVAAAPAAYLGDRRPAPAGHLPYDGPPAPADEPVEVRHFCGKTTRHHPHIGCNGFGLWAGPGNTCERVERHVPHRGCDGRGRD